MDNSYISKEQKRVLIKKVQDFFYEKRGETIGIIAADMVLDFFIDELASNIYNHAIDDAKKFASNYLDNMLIDLDTMYK